MTSSHKNAHIQEPAPLCQAAQPVGSVLTVAGITSAGDGAATPSSPASISLTCCESWRYETNPECMK